MINKYIDHTNLKPEATLSDIKRLCAEAIQYNFASVCVNPCYVSRCADLLKGTDVKVACVIGFPLGANTSAAKIAEAQEAVKNGAGELDMVVNIGRIKDGDYGYVQSEIEKIVSVGAVVKVILETCKLTDKEIVSACRAAVAAGASFVKTSTGFAEYGATESHVRLMVESVGDAAFVKASGGIRNRESAELMIGLGAMRIGTSAGVEICK